ncbi:Diguanylate cyclase OS=Tsukamurella paurometabola (strain ATCC 8368 / DSM / CCUG 35730 / CIP 100753 / JCM 10117 / KCTC 9821 / NBRC 16120 / NCIMB 702349/ NCTC 13040) OX=521096 GN=Tpau_2058 PE=4 SV=1 [Tsukamurella paurometabola]|uniref:Diguanylate cyclase n=1 Tax=Tsukamurella paurometabola (strain ATCC 8368 / DSM 20162 / CCUG 35730 / CIP 100753 / JCM 10117 / KCTC 9821 / NBRC 16120 / NCIMB 702349 / NCTC 13040) TaxID=521096 RepID=D5UNV2_TSUPD|nr:GGDEF domain-containing protein [Tsukamurella paurometabola]ADG78670.1 diguanylate cyclase [Tsukamurella paurometabola DSM 20162]SUP32657.1 Cyclic di-GMP phosphodiesterase Gmr [Tsukamurella paurometabola]
MTDSRRKPVTASRLARAAWRRLVDGEAWRNAGKAEFKFAQEGIAVHGGDNPLRWVVGGLALLMVPLCIGVLFQPMRPQNPVTMVVFVLASSGSLVVGLWWLTLKNPRRRDAVVFVAVADICLLVGCLAQDGPSRITGTIYLGMLAMLTAFLLGWRLLLVHCLFSVASIIAVTATTMVVNGYALMDLYVYLAPAITIEFALPVVVQVLVEFGRRGIGEAASERNHDALTGLYSRRGLQFALRRVLYKRGRGIAVVGLLDLDGFKQFNDSYGHLAGDQYLAETAQALRGGVRETLNARLGGDEFLIVAIRDLRADVDAVIDDLRALVTPGPSGERTIRGSIGIAVSEGLNRAEFAAAVAQADTALYEAKADRSLRIVIREVVAAPSPVPPWRAGLPAAPE